MQKLNIKPFYWGIFMLISLSSTSQKTSGTVHFGINFIEKEVKKPKKYEDNEKIYRYYKRMQKAHKSFYQQDITYLSLRFNNDEYRADPVEIMAPENSESRLVIRNPVVYGDLKNDYYIQQYKKQGNTFIAEVPNNFKWEIKNKYKNIAGYRCRKAVLKVEGSPNLDYTVWFTSQIPVAFSPVMYHSLPGAILGVRTSFKYIYAKKIEFKDDVNVEKPTKGVKISAKEYLEMMSGFKPPNDK